jgi:protein SCO1/2
MSRRSLIVACLTVCLCAASSRYSATGLVLKIDRAHSAMVISCQAIPGYMDAMTMPINVPDAKALDHLAPGLMIDFALVVDAESSHAEDIKVRKFESYQQEPQQARRLALMQGLAAPKPPPVAVGQEVPDFTLTDQNETPVNFATFKGKVVAMNFVYTRCSLPDNCYRLSNNLAQLQTRFAARMQQDLVLLTVTFDPVHDRPAVLANYAKTWKAGPGWHFLTGGTADVDHVCNLFGVDSWQDEGLLTHNMHTAVIDRHGKLVTNIEGNQFTAQQLGDLVDTVMKQTD